MWFVEINCSYTPHLDGIRINLRGYVHFNINAKLLQYQQTYWRGFGSNCDGKAYCVNLFLFHQTDLALALVSSSLLELGERILVAPMEDNLIDTWLIFHILY